MILIFFEINLRDKIFFINNTNPNQIMWNPEKKKVLDTAFNLEKQFGKGAIMKMDDTSRLPVFEKLSKKITLDVEEQEDTQSAGL